MRKLLIIPLLLVMAVLLFVLHEMVVLAAPESRS